MHIGTPKEQDARRCDLNVIDVSKEGNSDERNGFTERQRTTWIIIERQHAMGDAIMAVNILRHAKEALVAGKDATELKPTGTGFGDGASALAMGGNDGRRTPRQRRHGLWRDFADPDQKILDHDLARMSRCDLGKFSDKFLQTHRNRSSLAAMGKGGRDNAEADNEAGRGQPAAQGPGGDGFHSTCRCCKGAMLDLLDDDDASPTLLWRNFCRDIDLRNRHQVFYVVREQMVQLAPDEASCQWRPQPGRMNFALPIRYPWLCNA